MNAVDFLKVTGWRASKGLRALLGLKNCFAIGISPMSKCPGMKLDVVSMFIMCV